MPLFEDYLDDPVPCSYNYSSFLKPLWTILESKSPPHVIYRNFAMNYPKVCYFCGGEKCLSSSDAFRIYHPYAYEGISDVETLDKKEWSNRIARRSCILCSDTGCIDSFSTGKLKHPQIVTEMNKQRKKHHVFIPHIGIPVKSGDRIIQVDEIDCLNSVQSSFCTGLSYSADFMCFHCRNILKEPPVRIAYKRNYLKTIEIMKSNTAIDCSRKIIDTVRQEGIYCSEEHPGREIILGTAKMYRQMTLTEADYYHKIQHLMIEASDNRKINRKDHMEVLLWTLRGFITFGKAFIDHLNGQGYKLEEEDGDSIVFKLVEGSCWFPV